MSVVKAGQKSVTKSVRERSNGQNTTFLRRSLISKYSPKKLGFYLIHKSHNVEIKIYLDFFLNFGATQQTLTGHHDRHRPDILIKSTPADA